MVAANGRVVFLSWARGANDPHVIHVQDVTDGDPPLSRFCSVGTPEAKCGASLGDEPVVTTPQDGEKCRACMERAHRLGMELFPEPLPVSQPPITGGTIR